MAVETFYRTFSW